MEEELGVSPLERGKRCIPCAAGTYAAANKAQCLPCPPGHHSSMGSGSCSICKKGTYAEKPASSVCTPCNTAEGKSTFSVGSTSASECACPEGSFFVQSKCNRFVTHTHTHTHLLVAIVTK
eukprot:GHVR01151682.1.p2 GENE.GHVR01151682.1~~GHVR01151682.1.p2  ORF type:complete len:121 (-),score=34.99 GHVR01151682.1:417-779(-)